MTLAFTILLWLSIIPAVVAAGISLLVAVGMVIGIINLFR